MSEPVGATGPLMAAAHAEAGAMPPPLLPLPRRALVGAFLVDGILAAIIAFGASIVLSIFWGVWRAMEVSRSGVDSSGIKAAIGQPGVLAQLVFTLLCMSAAALSLYFLRRPASADERRQSFARLRQPATWRWAAAVGVAAFLGSSLIGYLASLAGIEPEPSNLAMVESAMHRWPWFLVVFVVLLAPAYEELLFRRVFFGRFLEGGRPWLGMVLSSVAFALLHEMPGVSANPPLAVLQLWLVYGGMGALFAWLYRRTGTLWAPILAHGLNNAIALAAHSLG